MKIKMKRGNWALRLLQMPLARTDFETAKKSRWTWGADTLLSEVWTLTPLGILHTLTGLCVEVQD